MQKKIYSFACLLSVFLCQSQLTQITNFGIGLNAIVGNKVLFFHQDAEHGKEIWFSDGTTAGTQLLYDTNPGPADGNPFYPAVIDGILYFQSNDHEVWRSDGTTVGTYKLVDNNLITNPRGFVKANGFIFFTAGSGSNTLIWKMQATGNSESIVTPGNQFAQADGVVALDDSTILFNGRNSSGWGLWRSNGVVNEFIVDLTATAALNNYKPLNGAVMIDGKVYFSTISEAYGIEPWTTNGSSTGTALLRDIYLTENYFNTSGASDFKKSGDWVYFSARDVTHGIELWRTNGTMAGTEMVKDIYPGNNENSWSPSSFLDYNGTLYFVANDGVSNTQIWKSNGTASGTMKITNLPNAYLSLNELFLDNGKIFFSMNDSATGSELWVLDLITQQATMLADIATGTTSSNPNSFFKLGNSIYFSANPTGTLASALFKINTDALTVTEIKDKNIRIYPNPTRSIVQIEAVNLPDYRIEVYDMTGKQLRNISNRQQVDFSDYASGIYFLKVSEDGVVVKTVKIIKQ